MKTFKTLDLAAQFYNLAKGLRLPSHLRDQMLRASSSIALNLSEGNAKLSPKEKRRFYQIAFGSLRECQTILRLECAGDPRLHDLADHLGACLYKLTRPLLGKSGENILKATDWLRGCRSSLWLIFLLICMRSPLRRRRRRVARPLWVLD